MAAITRSISISYGALTFSDAASGYAIEGPVSSAFAYRRATFDFSVVVYGSSVADLETKCTNLINQIRIPFLNIIVTFGTRVHSFKESDKTGWDAEGKIEPDDASVFNTHTTREYSISLQVTTPADATVDDGVSGYSYTHSIGPSGIRRFTLIGTITAINPLFSEDKYEAKIAAIVTATKAAIDPSAQWTEVLEDRGIDRFDFEMTFSRSYTERIFKDSLSADDVAALKQPSITIIPSLIYDANALPDTPRPIETVITYQAFVDSTVTVDLVTIWNEHVIPLLTEQAAKYSTELFGNDTKSVQEISPTFSPTGNTVSGMIRFVVFGPQKVLAVQIEESIQTSAGVIKVGVYGRTPYQRARLPGQATCKATLTATVTVQGSTAEALGKARGFANQPKTQSPPGARLVFGEYKLLTRIEAGKIGGRGGDWTLESESFQLIGPIYSGDPPIPVSTCVLVRVFDYDEDISETALRR